MGKRVIYLGIIFGLGIVVALAWNVTTRAGYESAQYEVVEKDGSIEIRKYPDLTLASTESKLDAQGKDGSFMRLFSYISGANEADQKIEMTTPVFMEKGDADSNGRMSFVMPQDVTKTGAPEPKTSDVSIRKREGGRFAVIRFSGQLNADIAARQESKLREWLESRGLECEESSETAGYDPPFTPGPLRRNEVLIRLNSPLKILTLRRDQ
ncbi:MAG: SOUL heme-binding protein [Planctomyces sp.]|nr:SOUL heme-binding protein [Planctomyces sp.]